jgi:hypothetical protein
VNVAAGDSYHEQILERLAGKLDPDAFERCMGDLLRDDLPGLAPVVGGSDGGFDGEIPDRAGEPYPLACTTSTEFSSVKRNLIGSLESARKKAWCRNKIAFATAARLTPPQRDKLRAAVRDRGALLTHLFDRDALADRLYRCPDCCMKLLGLPRRLRALSVVPESPRSGTTVSILGRDDDIEWLRTTAGDRLVYGQPGCGKTFLLRRVVAEGGSWFLVSDDPQQLESDLLELQPRVVIVDDAHVHPDRITLLRRMRDELGHRFEIIATCWPHDVAEVAALLGGLPAGKMRALELLTRDEIVELFGQLGVVADDDPMRFLVDQAANKPGLAVVMAQSWLDGDTRDVWTGEALRRDVVASFRQRIGRLADDVLAAISLGGEGGMPIDAVATCLGAQPRDIRLAAVELRAGGVLTEVAEAQVSVAPAALRTALVREAFFSRGASRSLVPLTELLDVAPRFEDAALEIVRCARSGGEVGTQQLREVVLRACASARHRSTRVWREAALIDAATACWVLEEYPGDVTDVARETLHHAPARTLGALLHASESASGEIRNTLDHPLRIVSDWCRRLEPDEAESLQRRRRLLASIERYSKSAGKADVAVQAGFLALDPSGERHSRDPGLGRTIHLRWAILSGASITALGEMWNALRPLVQHNPGESWPYVSDLLWKCAHPDGIHPAPMTLESRAALRSLGGQILRDLTPMAQGHPGIASRLADYADALGVTLELPRDETFEIVFPPHADAEPTDSDRMRIERLAAEWSSLPPADVVPMLSLYDHEQHFVAHGRANLLGDLCSSIAEAVDVPEEWIGEPTVDGAPPVLLAPLVSRCVREERPTAADVVDRCLAARSTTWNWIGVDGALRMRGLPPEMLGRALDIAIRFPDHVETLCSRGAVPIETLGLLLASDVVVLRIAGVVGEWLAKPRKQVRADVREQWHAAIRRTRLQDLDELQRSSSLEFWLGEIFRGDPDLSVAWLQSALPGNHFNLQLDGPLGDAIDGLSREQRIALVPTLAEVRVAADSQELPARLVAGDPDVYRMLICTTELPNAPGLHLAPLADPTRPEWRGLAIAALLAGYSPEDVAAASIDVADRIGDDTRRLKICRELFDRLRGDDDDGLAQVGLAGAGLVDACLERATRRARDQALRGI